MRSRFHSPSPNPAQDAPAFRRGEECAAADRPYDASDTYHQWCYTARMQQTVLVKLAPTPEQHAALLRALEAFNAACNASAAVAFAEHSASKFDLQKLVYYDIRQQFGLSAQMCIRA